MGSPYGHQAYRTCHLIPDPVLVLTPFTYMPQVVSIVLAFLLIFRTNFSYGRYWEARGWVCSLQAALLELGLQATPPCGYRDLSLVVVV